jgi:hypothetical protein
LNSDVYSGLKWGALIGGPLGILETLLYLLAYQEHNVANFDQASCLLIPMEAVLPFIAGFLAARQSSQERSGWIAGLTCGLIVAAINMITEIIYPLPLDFLVTDTGTAPSDAEMFVNTFFLRILTIGLGVGFGWLGGRQSLRLFPPNDKSR